MQSTMDPAADPPAYRIKFSARVIGAELTNAQWHALVYEPPLKPLLPIVDPHHHFFSKGFPPGALGMDSIKNTFGSKSRTWIGQPYLMQELAADRAPKRWPWRQALHALLVAVEPLPNQRRSLLRSTGYA